MSNSANAARRIEDIYPLTQLQLGVLYHSDYEADADLYHDLATYHLHGPFQQHQMQQAIAHLVQSHTVLRTAFNLSTVSKPVQIVYRGIDAPLSCEDISHLPQTDQAAYLDRWFVEERQRRFDWHSPPLIRFFVHRRSVDTFQLTISFHHAILDGWSLATLFNELIQAYTHYLDRAAVELPPLPATKYRAYVVLEQKAVASVASQNYWQNAVTEAPVLQLPRWRRAEQPDRLISKRQRITFADSLTEQLKRLARSQRVPLKTVLLSAHLRVMSAFCSQPDVVTGVVSNSRPELDGAERTLGLFVNTLPLRVQLGDVSWNGLIAETFQAEQAVWEHRFFPLPAIQQRIGRSLFDIAFNFTHFHVANDMTANSLVDVLAQSGFEDSGFVLFVKFSLNPKTGNLSLTLEYDAAHLCAAQVKQIGESYTAVCQQMAATPNASIHAASVLPKATVETVTKRWNETAAAFDEHTCLHQLFERQVRQSPNATAAEFESCTLTYAALNQRANRVAHYLTSLGVGRETRVALYFDRSLEMLIGLLAVLKAGGAYVPLDPSFPDKRNAYIMADAGAELILTHAAVSGALKNMAIPVLDIDQHRAQIDQCPHSNRPTTITPNNLAYLIYTSGSTGRPKGVQIQHRSVVNFLAAMRHTVGIRPTDKLLAVTTISFDIAVLELLLPVVNGGCVHIASRETVADGRKLSALLTTSESTMMQATPTTWQLLVDGGWNGDETLTIVSGGEALPSPLAQALRQRGNAVWNLYGPTETTIWSCASCITDEPPPVSIGRPIDNTAVYVLDHYLQPAPMGSLGELYIGGAGLARGYHQRPVITAQNFIPDPFSGEPGARIYRTGDLAYFEPDGRLVCLGRTDYQIKLRGHRIELQEIEAVLNQHATVNRAVTTVHGDGNERMVVGYIVSAAPNAFDPQTLRRYLKAHLPLHMVPTVLIELETLPLTENGKINRRRLPAPDVGQLEAAAPIAPRTPIEAQVATVWAEVLSVETVGVQTSFFDLGGHSLQAVRLAHQLGDLFNMPIPIRLVMEGGTVESVALYILNDLLGQLGETSDDVLEQLA